MTTLARLERRRFEPVVATLFEPSHLAEELADLGIPFHRIHMGGPAGLPRAVLAVRRLIAEERIDLVHTHLFFANVVGRLAALGRAPVVTTLHNPDYTYEPSRGRKALDRLTLTLSRPKLLAVSEEVRRDYERHFGLDGIEVLYNYMEVRTFRERVRAVDRVAERERLGLGPEDILVLHCGRFQRQKAQDTLLRAFADAGARAPRLRLAFAGDGPGLDAARRLAEELGVEGAAAFLGSVRDMAPLYAAADAFAFPSRFEAFGVALLEAMAAGLPTVVTRAGGILELTTDDTSLRVDVDDAAALAAALARLATDPELRARLGEAGAARADGFDAAVWVPRLEAVYDGL